MFQALYLHVPFCVRRCAYCDFYSAATRRDDPLVAAYVQALGHLVRRAQKAGLLAGVATAYVGGGTPSLAGAALADLVRTVRAAAPGLLEFTSEANPESLSGGLVDALAAAGLTRVSLGVQSTCDNELKVLGRAHSAAQALAAARTVAGAGLALSCDLMCGIPLQTPASWDRSLNDVLAAGATHVSCYPLMVEEGTPLAAAVDAGRVAEPDSDVAADCMERAAEVLGAAGLARYEVASYARPGRACLHNEAYWTGRSYLGLGSGASGMAARAEFAALAAALPLAVVEEGAGEGGDAGEPGVPGGVGAPTPVSAGAYLDARPDAARIRFRMADAPRDLVRKLSAGEPLLACAEALTAREAAAEDLMLALRMTRGASPDLLRRAVADGVPAPALASACEDACARGLAERTPDGGLAPTHRGWLLGNELYGLMWDLAGDD